MFGEHNYIGSFNTEEEAKKAYALAKIGYLKSVLHRYYPYGDARVVHKLKTVIEEFERTCAKENAVLGLPKKPKSGGKK